MPVQTWWKCPECGDVWCTPNGTEAELSYKQARREAFVNGPRVCPDCERVK